MYVTKYFIVAHALRCFVLEIQTYPFCVTKNPHVVVKSKGKPVSDAGKVGGGDDDGGSGFPRDPSSNCKVMSFSPVDGQKFAWSDGGSNGVRVASWKAGKWEVTAR